MTPAEETLYRRILARVGRLEPEIGKRVIAAYRAIQALLDEREMADAISSRQIDQIIVELLSDDALDPALRPLRVQIDRAVLEGSRLAARDLPAKLAGTAFDILNPKIIEAARALDTRVIDGLKDELRTTVKQHVIAGLEEGLNPREIARGIRSVVPLAPNQEAAVRNYRRMLEGADPTALARKLRDRRFDSTVRRAFESGDRLPDAKIETMTEAYRRRMVDFNAKTQSRTAALDAQRAGQRASWEDAISRGVLDRDRLQRTWMAVGGPGGDGHNRPDHLAMHGETVPFDQPYSNGEMTPGESTYGCRCFEKISIARAAVDRLLVA